MSVYLETLRLMEENGWSSGAPHGPKGEMCLAVAYQAAAGGLSALDLYKHSTLGTAYLRLGELMRQQYEYMTIVEFNDAPETTFEEVALLLKRAHELHGDEAQVPQ